MNLNPSTNFFKANTIIISNLSLAKKVSIAWLVFIGLLLLTSCGEPDSNTATLTGEISLQELVELNLNPSPSLLDTEILAKLGQPHKIERESFPNRYRPEQMDAIHTYYYDGLQFSVYHLNQSNKTFMIDMIVSSARYDTAIDVHIGSSKESVEHLLGQADKHINNNTLYQLPDSADTLSLVFEHDRVIEMVWLFYLE